MAGYCTSVWPYFHEPQASENPAQECNIAFSHINYCNIRNLLYYSDLEDRQLLRMCSTKVIVAWIFNELLAASLFLALDGTSMRADPSTSERKYCKSVNIAVFIPNESLFVVSAAATSALQLKHTLQLLHSICPARYQIRTIEYGKILVVLLYVKYYWHVYDVYTYMWNT